MRLVVFGCSVAWGSGLASSDDNAFSIIAKKLNVEYDNRAVPSGSNTEIVYNILNYKFKPNDIVVVCWTYVMREMLITPKGITRISHWSTDEWGLLWRQHADPHDYAVKYFMNAYLIKSYLSTLNIKKQLHFTLDDHYTVDKAKKTLPFAKDFNFDYDLMTINAVDWVDCGHPGPLTHLAVVDTLYDKFFA